MRVRPGCRFPTWRHPAYRSRPTRRLRRSVRAWRSDDQGGALYLMQDHRDPGADDGASLR